MGAAEKRFYATGKRKTAIARVYMKTGSGVIVVNKRSFDDYFTRDSLKMIIQRPLELVGQKDLFDVYINVHGGGISGQAGAVKHGISKALLEVDGEYRSILKKAGFPHPGFPNQRTKEIRTAWGQETVPVLQALIFKGGRWPPFFLMQTSTCKIQNNGALTTEQSGPSLSRPSII